MDIGDFFEFLDGACLAVLEAEQRGERPEAIVVPPGIYEVVAKAKDYEVKRGFSLSLLGLRLERPGKTAADGAAVLDMAS